jgi:NAD(P)-dependent dehydrogenase (short-subunit alcohol dehydrogenase family)
LEPCLYLRYRIEQLYETMSVFREGSTALITGGASGIGLAVAQLCLKQGMRVAVVDFNSTTLDLAKKTLNGGDNVETFHVDVSKDEQWADLQESVGKRFGDVDFLMLNAGVGVRGTWGDKEYFHKVCWCVLSVDCGV